VSAPNGLTSIAVPGTPLSPDEYKNYALQDPGYLALQSSLKGNEDAYRANARGGINRGVIGLGILPTDNSMADWLDPGTAAAAQANQQSTGAQLGFQHGNNVRAIQNALAARGGYDSGELTYGLGNENTRDTQARSDALSKFMDYANGLFGNLGQMQAGDAGQLGQELGSAAMRQLSLHPGSTTSATWDDSSGTYVDGNGNHYDQYGNHIGTGSAPTTNFGAPAPGTNLVSGAEAQAYSAPPVPNMVAQGIASVPPAQTQPIFTQYTHGGSFGAR
jgi:hypothetical protein